MPVMIPYPKLKKGLTEGVKVYNERRNSNEYLGEHTGSRNGEKGRTKGIKAAAYLEKIDEQNTVGLLCLAMALFASSSKGLTQIIATCLIQGMREQRVGDGLDGKPTDTLESSVFSVSDVHKSKCNESNIFNSTGPSVTVSTYIHRRGVRNLLKQAVGEKYPTGPDRVRFNNQVKQMKRNLRDKKSEEIDLGAIPTAASFNS